MHCGTPGPNEFLHIDYSLRLTCCVTTILSAHSSVPSGGAASDRAPTKFVPVDGGCGHDHSESAPPSKRMRPEELTSHYGREKDGTKL